MHTRNDFLTGRKPSLRRMVGKGKGKGKGTRKIRSINKTKKGRLATMIVPTFLDMLNTVKLYHWKTTSYSTHKATDELYAKMGELTDHFVEVMLGKEEMGGRGILLNGSPRENVYVLNLTLYSSNTEFQKQIGYYKTFLINLSNDAVFNSGLNVDLLAVRDELLAELNKFLYLLSLH